MEFGGLIGVISSFVDLSQHITSEILTPTDLQGRRCSRDDEEASGTLSFHSLFHFYSLLYLFCLCIRVWVRFSSLLFFELGVKVKKKQTNKTKNSKIHKRCLEWTFFNYEGSAFKVWPKNNFMTSHTKYFSQNQKRSSTHQTESRILFLFFVLFCYDHFQFCHGHWWKYDIKGRHDLPY